jgi:hypothetical protein
VHASVAAWWAPWLLRAMCPLVSYGTPHDMAVPIQDRQDVLAQSWYWVAVPSAPRRALSPGSGRCTEVLRMYVRLSHHGLKTVRYELGAVFPLSGSPQATGHSGGRLVCSPVTRSIESTVQPGTPAFFERELARPENTPAAVLESPRVLTGSCSASKMPQPPPM